MNFALVRHLFIFRFLSRRKSRLVLPHTPLHVIDVALFTPFHATFLLSFMAPYPLIVRPMEFRLVFASLVAVAFEAGHSPGAISGAISLKGYLTIDLTIDKSE